MPPADRPAARGLPAWLLAASSAGSAAMVAVGVSLRSGLGTWLACCAVGGWVLGAGSILAARRLMDRPQPAVWQARPTGATLQPCPFPQEAPAAFRWIGGCNVPGNLGRLNATFPLAVLEVAPGSAALRVRPHAMAAVFGAAKPMTFAPAGDLTAFPVRGRLASRGIGLQYAGHPASYFWTGEREMVLTVLAMAGFNTSWAEMRPRLY